ncbi:MAG: hypothetical protein QNK03_19160 [Myxococcota bacterium]|nr:hypothetical protein [Myxococcota bacterium]
MRTPKRIAVGLLAVALAAPVAGADEPDSCREWTAEHREWTAEVVRRYLGPASQEQVDEAVFELLQREAWLTSCEQTVRRARVAQVGWRLVDREPDEYAGVVIEALLERAGFDLTLTRLHESTPSVPAAPPVRPRARRAAR